MAEKVTLPKHDYKEELQKEYEKDKKEMNHKALIPIQHKRIKDYLDQCSDLTNKEKKLIFIAVSTTIQAMNNSHLHLWFLDILKTGFQFIFLREFTENKEFLKLLRLTIKEIRSDNESN